MRKNNSKNKLKENNEMKRDKGQYLQRPSIRWLYYKGVVLHLSGWAEAQKMNIKTLHNRLNRLGWSIDKALTTPVRGREHGTN
jgi:hypothetical protein